MIKLYRRHKWNNSFKDFLQAFRIFLNMLSFILIFNIFMSVFSLSLLLFLPFGTIAANLGVLLSTVVPDLATFSFQCMSPTMIFTLTGSPLLLTALWNSESVKQIVKWCVSTFRQCSNLEHFFSLWIMGFTPPAGWKINLDNRAQENTAHYNFLHIWVCGFL